MRSFRANPATPYPAQIHPALTSFADECCGTLARLLAYVGALALLAILGIHLWDELPTGEAIQPSAKAGWSAATRSYPAFAVSQFDLSEKTETYEIFRHPEGGRKDVFRWAAQGEKPIAELNQTPALSFCLSMISGQTLRVCPEGKPVSTFSGSCSDRRTCQDAGFHATFSHSAALCDAVWPN